MNDASRAAAGTRAGSALRFALVLGIAAWTAIGGCSSQPKVEEQLETEVNLNTGQEVQNVVSFPFRIVGGAVMYPLKFLFFDMPNGIADAFRDELHDAKEKLKSSVPGERLAGVTLLAESGIPQAVPELVKCLADREPVIRSDAALSLARLGRDVVTAGEQHGDLQHGRPVEDHLIARLNDADYRVRMAAAVALGDLGSPRALLPLRRLYRSRKVQEDIASFYLLARAKLGDPTARADAMDLLKRVWRPVTISNALLSLGYLGGDDAKRELHRALSHPDERVQIAAITALGVARDFGTLLTLARDGAMVQRRAALYSLGKYGGRQFVGVLERYRQSPETGVRIAATLAMGSTGYPRAAEPLIQLLRDPDAMTRLQALTMLMELTQHNMGLEPDAWISWWNSDGADFVKNNTPEKYRDGDLRTD